MHSMNLSLTGKNALVCGGSKGIGRAAAMELAALGANVTIVSRSAAALGEVLSVMPRVGDQDHGVAGAGQEIATRPFQLVTGRTWKGTAFGGARGRSDVPRIVDWYMDGKINIDDLITHTMPLDDINKGFDLMHAGESIRSVVLY